MMNHKCKDDVLVEEHKEEGALSPVSIAPGFRWLEVWSALCVSQEESPGSLHEVIDSGYCHVFGKISFLFIFWVVLSAWMLDWEMYPCKLSMALCGLATSASPVVISLFKSKMGVMSWSNRQTFIGGHKMRGMKLPNSLSRWPANGNLLIMQRGGVFPVLRRWKAVEMKFDRVSTKVLYFLLLTKIYAVKL